MQKPRKRFLSAIVAVAMCLSQFAPVTAYAVESASGITQSEEAPKETDALSTTTTNSDSSATTPAPKSDVTDTASSASSDTSVTSDVSSEATSQAGSETTTAYANSAASDTGASTSTSSEASTTGSISEAAQAFIDAANALVSRKDEILTAANNFGLASKAWQADKENAVLDAMVTRRTEELDFFTQAVKNGVAPAPPLNMSSRPRIDMCMSSFRISTSIGVNHHSLYKFPITEKMKERICAIMAMSCTVDPRKMVHRASIDRGIRDAYIALVWQYVVSSFGEKQQKNAILEKSTTIYNQRKLRKRELENKKYEEQLKQKASEVKKEVAEASTNAKLEKVKKELYDFKATSMKRETALRKKNDDAESRIHELEKLLANAERKLIQLRPETSEFDDFDDSDAGICEQETEVIDYHKELNQMAKNKKIVFCGGQQNFVNMLRNAQPDISYVDQCNLATCDALIANSDIVIFRVTQMSHSLYGKAKQICKARGIRFEHLPNVTSIPLTEELIYTLITKKEATGNE